MIVVDYLKQAEVEPLIIMLDADTANKGRVAEKPAITGTNARNLFENYET